MGAFDELNKNLHLPAVNTEAKQATLLEVSKQDIDGVIREIFALAGEYYATVISERTALEIVPQQREYDSSKPIDVQWGDTFYAYVMNLIPTGHLPYSLIPGESDFMKEGKFTESHPRFNPNIAMQLELDLNRRMKPEVHLEPQVMIRVLGKSAIPEDATPIYSSGYTTPSGYKTADGLYIYYADLGWNKYGTVITYYPDTTDIESVRQLTIKALTIVTPNILRHTEIVREGKDQEIIS